MNVRLIERLAAAWAQSPELTFGQLVESVESLAWSAIPERHVSTRLLHMSNEEFGAACDQWAASPAVRKMFRLHS
jgi:hypothetical protein